MQRLREAVLLILLVGISGCSIAPRGARLYDLEGTQNVIQAIFQGTSNHGAQGTVTLTTPTGEVCTGEYSATPNGGTAWGSIYYKNNKGVRGTGSYSSISASWFGTAVAAGNRGSVFRCEFRATPKGPAHGGCTDNRGHSYELMFDAWGTVSPPVNEPLPTVAVAPQGATPRSGPKAGFRDLRWGDGVTAGLVRLEDRGAGQVAYARPSDSLTVGPVPLESITYVFFSGGLRGVEVEVKPGEVTRLVATLNDVWGSREYLTGGKRPISKWYASNGGSDDTVALLFHEADAPNLLLICNERFYQERHDRRLSK